MGMAMLALCALLAVMLAPLSSVQRAAASDWSPPSTVYIPDTGHSIDGVFLTYWRGNGGVNVFGNPVTAEMQQNGHTVQYYQYARFEYWPEDAGGAVVHLGLIGAELRPQVVLRNTFSGVGSIGSILPKAGATSSEAVKMAMAWAPLDAKITAKPTTDAWQYIPETKHSIANGFKTYWQNSGGSAYLGNPLTEEYALKGITYQVFERGQLAWKQNSDPWQVAVGSMLAKKYKFSTAATGQGDAPTYSEDLFIEPKKVVAPVGGQSGGSGERWVDINLATQYLVAYEGNTSVLETYVSTGREGFETPTGTFFVNSKLESQTMAGVIGGETYNVPDVPWVMYFTDQGHALHGTYWHSNFGTQMSHGCVNLPMDVAQWMYGWSSIGMRVVIHY